MIHDDNSTFPSDLERYEPIREPDTHPYLLAEAVEAEANYRYEEI